MLNLPLHVQFCVMLVLSSWIVKLAIFRSADWAVNRNMLDCSITWEANWEHFPLRLQSMYSLKCLSILTVTKIGDCDLWRRARLQIKKKVNFPQKTIEGVVHLQPRLHAPVDSLPTLIVVVTFPITHLNVVLPRLPPLQCCTTDQACPRCPTSAHGKWSTSLRSPSARLPTSPGCVLCRPPRPRRSRSCYLPSLYQVWPWGCIVHSGRNPQIASFAERGSPPTAG